MTTKRVDSSKPKKRHRERVHGFMKRDEHKDRPQSFSTPVAR